MKDHLGQIIGQDCSEARGLPSGCLVRHLHLDSSDVVDIVRKIRMPGPGRSTYGVVDCSVHFYFETENDAFLFEMGLDKTSCRSHLIVDPCDGRTAIPFPGHPYVLTVDYSSAVDVRAERASHAGVPHEVSTLVRFSDAAVSEAFTRERLQWEAAQG
ncbi:hypothetical protein Mnod_7725 (plasmid) [Methylobacterium nodulans ORS 2060]|uniref:Uncharacterized protein n=2 Tax=Methylobacterium nodulans TaxID=114616 RepID=B8IY28_METNO|nr:hypothetical protein Mnod_7725 [Methylobacterium nodulans ORS 2060]